MKAQYHPNGTDTEEVDVLDIYIDDEGQPRMMFVRADGRIETAPIGRFTELRNGTPPVKQQYRLRILGDGKPNKLPRNPEERA